jgi:hypothetical protein
MKLVLRKTKRTARRFSPGGHHRRNRVLLGADQRLREVGRLFAALCRHNQNNLKYSDESFAARVSSPARLTESQKNHSRRGKSSAAVVRCYNLAARSGLFIR